MNEVKIIPVLEHFEAYEGDKFLCSGGSLEQIIQGIMEDNRHVRNPHSSAWSLHNDFTCFSVSETH